MTTDTIKASLLNKCIFTQIQEHKNSIKLANANVSSITDQRYADAMVDKYSTEIEQLEALSRYIEEHFYPMDNIQIVNQITK